MQVILLHLGKLQPSGLSLSGDYTRDRSGSGRQVGLMRAMGQFLEAPPCRESGLSLQGSGHGQGKEGWGPVPPERDRPL